MDTGYRMMDETDEAIERSKQVENSSIDLHILFKWLIIGYSFSSLIVPTLFSHLLHVMVIVA